MRKKGAVVNKLIASVWGFITLLPFAYVIYFFIFIGNQDIGLSAEEAHRQFDAMWRLHMIFMFLIMGLIGSYVVYLFKTQHVPNDKKALWAVVLFLGHVVAMPIFWFIYVWRPLLQPSQKGAA
jgi:NhaP-type Na+/H+ and K+/H+ antiporter